LNLPGLSRDQRLEGLRAGEVPVRAYATIPRGVLRVASIASVARCFFLAAALHPRRVQRRVEAAIALSCTLIFGGGRHRDALGLRGWHRELKMNTLDGAARRGVDSRNR